MYMQGVAKEMEPCGAISSKIGKRVGSMAGHLFHGLLQSMQILYSLRGCFGSWAFSSLRWSVADFYSLRDTVRERESFLYV